MTKKTTKAKPAKKAAPKNKPEGQKHIDAVEKDRLANLKAMEK